MGRLVTGDALRRAVADLSGRERDVLRHHAEQAARKWSGTLPSLAAVWQAFADLIADVDTNARARQAADMPEHQMRHARRPRS